MRRQAARLGVIRFFQHAFPIAFAWVAFFGCARGGHPAGPIPPAVGPARRATANATAPTQPESAATSAAPRPSVPQPLADVVFGIGWLGGDRLRVITSRSVTLYARELRSVARCDLPGSPADNAVDTNWFSRDADWIALYDQQRSPLLLHVSDCSTRRISISSKSFPDGLAVFSLSGDGSRYALSKDELIEIHDVKSDRLLATKRLSRRSQSTRTLSGGTLTKNGQIIWLAAAHVCDSGNSCFFDGKLAVDGNRIIDSRTQRLVAELEGGKVAQAYAISSDSKSVAFVPASSRELVLAATKTGAVIDRLDLDQVAGETVRSAESLQFSVDGDRIGVVFRSEAGSGAVAVIGVEKNRLRAIGKIP